MEKLASRRDFKGLDVDVDDLTLYTDPDRSNMITDEEMPAGKKFYATLEVPTAPAAAELPVFQLFDPKPIGIQFTFVNRPEFFNLFKKCSAYLQHLTRGDFIQVFSSAIFAYIGGAKGSGKTRIVISSHSWRCF